MTRHGSDPTPPMMQAVEQKEDSLNPARHAGVEPNPLAGNEMWSNLESSILERARRPGAIMRSHQLNPESLPDDLGLQVATYTGVKALRHKVESFCKLSDQTAESKRAVVAAAWFAEQDIRTLCETFADPIAGISISEDGFVVIHMSVMERTDMVCLLAVAPSGESALRMDGEGHGWVSMGLDPFHRTNAGQKVKDYLGTLPSCQ